MEQGTLLFPIEDFSVTEAFTSALAPDVDMSFTANYVSGKLKYPSDKQVDLNPLSDIKLEVSFYSDVDSASPDINNVKFHKSYPVTPLELTNKFTQLGMTAEQIETQIGQIFGGLLLGSASQQEAIIGSLISAWGITLK